MALEKILALCFTVFLFVAVPLLAQEYEKYENLRLEEYQVYDALIQKMFLRPERTQGANKLDVVVIKKETDCSIQLTLENAEPILKVFRNKFRYAQMDTTGDFIVQNAKSSILGDFFQFPYKHILAEGADLKKIFTGPGKGWERYYKKYPRSQGVLILSRIGFDSDKNQALIYVENRDGEMPPEGQFILMVLKDEKWSIVSKFPRSILLVPGPAPASGQSPKEEQKIEIKPIRQNEIKGEEVAPEQDKADGLSGEKEIIPAEGK